MNDGHSIDEVLRLYNSRKVEEFQRALPILAKRQQEKLGRPPRSGRGSVVVRRNASVPGLAWIAELSPGRCVFTIGERVESSGNAIFEGVWDGDFAARAFQRSSYAFGSGAIWGKHLIFVPPRHCWESLYVLVEKARGRTFVSNSINFALSEAEIDLNGELFGKIEADLHASTNASTFLGIDLYEPVVVETATHRLLRMMYYNFVVDEAGRVRILPLELEAPPRGYQAYRSFLIEKMRQILANGSHPSRKFPLSPIVPISNGYDSPCVGVLAREVGVEEAVTIGVTVKGKDDSGENLARRLGFRVTAVPHVLGTEVPRLAVAFDGERAKPIYEFIATGGTGDDVTFLPFEPHLRDRIFLTGNLGDVVWRRNAKLPPGLPVRIAYGKSLTEYRLRVGFASVPVPAIGARFPHPITRMTRTPEMADYTLWQPYDRPFPRRVIEEAGIPRGAFAISKSATSPTALNRAQLFRPAVTEVLKRYARPNASSRAGPELDRQGGDHGPDPTP